MPGRAARILTAALALLAVLSAGGAAAAGKHSQKSEQQRLQRKAAPHGPLGHAGRWITDAGGRELKVRVDGQLVFNSSALSLRAAIDGFGLAYLPEDRVQAHLADGWLIRVLADWCPPFPGYHLYYPSRRQPTPAFALLVDALRYRG